MSLNHRQAGRIRGAQVADAMLKQSQILIEGARTEQEQLDLLSPVTPEEMQIAQEALGPGAGHLAVTIEARERRAGRIRGQHNKRSDDFRRYILSFGQDPAVTLMQIQNTQPEILMARSKGLDFDKRRLSYGDAQALRVRCAEALLPYIHSKQPIAIDGTIRGVVVHETIGRVEDFGEAGELIDGEIVGVVLDGEEGP